MSPFHGLSAFPITPATAAGQVDLDDLVGLIDVLIAAGVGSIGLLGSTGTYAYLTRSERSRAVTAGVKAANGQVPVIVGVGALRTDDACNLAQDAERAGADAVLLAPVSYTPLTEEEVFAHFQAVSDASGLPVCIYNNPGTTHFTFSEDLIARLAPLPKVKAVKMPLPADGDYTGQIARLRTQVPADFSIGYSADWGMAHAMLAGADAFYSVIGGLVPQPVLALCNAARLAEEGETLAMNARFAPLWALFQTYGSLRVVYAAAQIMGLTSAEPPRPILPLGPDVRTKVKDALERIGAL